MKLDMALMLVLAFLAGLVSSVIVVTLIERAKPQFAVVDMKALIAQQTARLIASQTSEVELTTRGREAARHILSTIRIWGRAHNMILFSKSHCLSSLPEVTAEIEHVLRGERYAD